jgi:hypothetical protein
MPIRFGACVPEVAKVVQERATHHGETIVIVGNGAAPANALGLTIAGLGRTVRLGSWHDWHDERNGRSRPCCTDWGNNMPTCGIYIANTEASTGSEPQMKGNNRVLRGEKA